MSDEVGFSMDVKVVDRDVFFNAAFASALEDGLSEEGALEILRPNGEIDVGACLIQLCDPGTLPGCEIHGSDAETHNLPFIKSEDSSASFRDL